MLMAIIASTGRDLRGFHLVGDGEELRRLGEIEAGLQHTLVRLDEERMIEPAADEGDVQVTARRLELLPELLDLVRDVERLQELRGDLEATPAVNTAFLGAGVGNSGLSRSRAIIFHPFGRPWTR